MRAAILDKINTALKIQNIEVPSLEPDEVLVKTKACGICRTDLHLRAGELKPGKIPIILGHEAAGVVQLIGEKVVNWRRGDRVIPYRYFSCGKCYSCIRGNEEVCYDYIGQLGFNWDGGYAEYFKIPDKYLIRLPEGLSFQDGGTIACSGQTAYHAVIERAKVEMGQDILIIGAGGVGLQALQFSKIAGANVLVADRSEKKLEFAREYGADQLLNLNMDLPKKIKRLTQGLGVDATIDTTASGRAIKLGLESLRKLGKLVLIGASEETIPGITSTMMLVNEFEILGSRSSTKQELIEAVSIAASSKIKSIVTEAYRIEEINEALEKLKNGGILGRAVVVF